MRHFLIYYILIILVCTLTQLEKRANLYIMFGIEIQIITNSGNACTKEVNILIIDLLKVILRGLSRDSLTMPKERVAKKSRTHQDVQKQGKTLFYHYLIPTFKLGKHEAIPAMV